MRMEDRIKALLSEKLNPAEIEVKNMSHLHAGHAGDDGSGESHFRVMVVSKMFENKGKIERHRMVFGILQCEIKAIHALEIKAFTPDEREKV